MPPILRRHSLWTASFLFRFASSASVFCYGHLLKSQLCRNIIQQTSNYLSSIEQPMGLEAFSVLLVLTPKNVVVMLIQFLFSFSDPFLRQSIFLRLVPFLFIFGLQIKRTSSQLIFSVDSL